MGIDLRVSSYFLVGMQIVEFEDDYVPHRVPIGSSLACGVPFSQLLCIDKVSRKSFSYNKLPQAPLRLNIVKLDGSCFDVAVSRTGTVEELKRAVEAAFSHLPQTGCGKVSWSHVWANFCLSYNNEKLLSDGDYLVVYGIKDGDQLRFIHHASISYDLVKQRSRKKDPDWEDEPNIRAGHTDNQRNEERDDSNDVDRIIIDQYEGDGDAEPSNHAARHRGYKLTRLFGRSSSRRKLMERKSQSSRFSRGSLGSFKSVVRFYSDKYL